jgi:hypothetical protein
MGSSIDTWKPYFNYVQDGLTDGQFLNAAFTLLAAGPPRLSNVGGATAAAGAISAGAGGSIAWPIGIVQNINLSHNRQFSRVFELGSERSYFISGRTVGQMGLSRILYHGPSLLRVLYAYYTDLFPPTIVQPIFTNIGGVTTPNPHDVKIPPGYENIFLNLASDLFAQPIGMLMYMKDSNEDTVGAGYLENCYVPTHMIATDAQGTVIQENATLQFERLVPVAVTALALINSGSASALGFAS